MSFPPLFCVFTVCWLHFSCHNSGQLRDRLFSLESVTEIITSRSLGYFPMFKIDKYLLKQRIILNPKLLKWMKMW